MIVTIVGLIIFFGIDILTKKLELDSFFWFVFVLVGLIILVISFYIYDDYHYKRELREAIEGIKNKLDTILHKNKETKRKLTNDE